MATRKQKAAPQAEAVEETKAPETKAAENKAPEAGAKTQNSRFDFANDVHITRHQNEQTGKTVTKYEIPYATVEGKQGRLEGYVNNPSGDKGQLYQTARDAKKGAEFDPNTANRANVKLGGPQKVEFTPYQMDDKGAIVKTAKGNPMCDFDAKQSMTMDSKQVAETAKAARQVEIAEFKKTQEAAKSDPVAEATAKADKTAAKAVESEKQADAPQAGE